MRMTKANSFLKVFFGIFIMSILVTGCASCASKSTLSSQDKKEIRERAEQSQKGLEQEETKKGGAQ